MNCLSPEPLRIVQLAELPRNVADSELIACLVDDALLIHFEPPLKIGLGIEQQDLVSLARPAQRLTGTVLPVPAASATPSRVAAQELAASRRDLPTVHSELAPQVVTLARALRAWRERSRGRAR